MAHAPSRFRPSRARHRGTAALVALLAVSILLTGCEGPTAAGEGLTSQAPSSAAITPTAVPPTTITPTAGGGSASGGTTAAPPITLGRGFLTFPGTAQAWVLAHPKDPRTPLIRSRIASQPAALWLTGDESFGNLRQAVALGRKSDRTLLLTMWNIPQRYDGLSAPTRLSLTAYERWVDTVASTIGTTSAVVVLEPDALWFYDRLPTDEDRVTRGAALRYAVERLRTHAPHTRVYLDAGTSSGSVTPARMATLLLHAGLADAAGFAVNVSSYAPTTSIQHYAQRIRAALSAKHVVNPRYVIDTGRNGATKWNYDWCNPAGQRLGRTPGLVRAASGLDMALWIKAPGTSDGSCGPAGGGQGTYGGQFLPSVAYEMITG